MLSGIPFNGNKTFWCIIGTTNNLSVQLKRWNFGKAFHCFPHEQMRKDYCLGLSVGGHSTNPKSYKDWINLLSFSIYIRPWTRQIISGPKLLAKQPMSTHEYLLPKVKRAKDAQPQIIHILRLPSFIIFWIFWCRYKYEKNTLIMLNMDSVKTRKIQLMLIFLFQKRPLRAVWALPASLHPCSAPSFGRQSLNLPHTSVSSILWEIFI